MKFFKSKKEKANKKIQKATDKLIQLANKNRIELFVAQRVDDKLVFGGSFDTNLNPDLLQTLTVAVIALFKGRPPVPKKLKLELVK